MRVFLLTLFLCTTLLAENLYTWKIVRTIDGDTVEMQVDFLPEELGNKLRIRVWGVDTPEKGFRAQSVHEAEMGERASAFTKQLIGNAKDIKVTIVMWDKFGGRVLGDLIIDGKSLRQQLLDNGFAREYYGTKKESWD
jgi:endonuclease YncB( thermonuclease family)